MALYFDFYFPNWLDVAARSHPDKLALTFESDTWTFAELQRSTDHAASILISTQENRGGRIGILSANRPGFVFAIHAATRLGIPVVPLNYRQTSHEIAWQVQNAGITVLVVDDDRLAAAESASAEFSLTISPIDELEQSSPDAPPSPDSTGAGYPLGGGRGVRASITLNHEAAIIYTSGASGRPKGARITYGNLWFSAIASALHLGHDLVDVWLAAMPLFHIGGLSILYRGVISATQVILHDRFDPETSLRAIDSGATLVSVVPTMLQRMLELRGDAPWPATLRGVLVGGSSASPELITDALRLGIPMAPTYGLTETSSQVATLLPSQTHGKPSSSGLPLPLTEVRIETASGPAKSGEIGEIEVRGPTVFAGYIGEADANSGRTADGWFQTGDAGYLDGDGYLYVVDRRDDLIISGGENVYPAEIERVLREHPLVADAGVVGVPDESWGARPVAAVVWSGAELAVEVELLRHCKQRLSAYKIPDRIVAMPRIPRLPSGKLLRRVLREMVVETSASTQGKPSSSDR